MEMPDWHLFAVWMPVLMPSKAHCYNKKHMLLRLLHAATRSTQRAQTSTDPEDPDFGLWTPGSEA